MYKLTAIILLLLLLFTEPVFPSRKIRPNRPQSGSGMTVWKNDKASVNVQLPWSKIGKEGKRGLKKTGKELGRFGKRAGKEAKRFGKRIKKKLKKIFGK
ncbi:hypothetical protein OSTOST_09194 [Ostertagia ostertagi]